MAYEELSKSDPELAIKFSRICIHCGEFWARHKADHNNCPVIEDGRTVGYKEEYFKEWNQ